VIAEENSGALSEKPSPLHPWENSAAWEDRGQEGAREKNEEMTLNAKHYWKQPAHEKQRKAVTLKPIILPQNYRVLKG